MSSPSPDEKRFERLGRALRKAEERRKIFVPPTLDEAILKEARRHFEGGPEFAKMKAPSQPVAARGVPPFLDWRWILGGALAVVALCFVVLEPFARKPVVVAREDINGDGRVDILDALALAKAVEGKTNNERLDQNDDRQLDDADVRAVALAAVRLDRKPGS
jgi:hypothetical protein